MYHIKKHVYRKIKFNINYINWKQLFIWGSMRPPIIINSISQLSFNDLIELVNEINIKLA